MDAMTAASYLKSFNISSLFISGEVITLYDKDDHFVCDNSVVGL
jgi:hypothetical protein